MNDPIERLIEVLKDKTARDIRKAKQDVRNNIFDNSAFLPLVISDPTYEVPAGRQIIFDTLEVSAATTLTIAGRMCVRDGLENGGVIENSGVLKLG